VDGPVRVVERLARDRDQVGSLQHAPVAPLRGCGPVSATQAMPVIKMKML
jgi:hypothetical protein